MWVSDAVFGVVLLLLATAIIVLAQAFPAMPGQDYGPALFPTLIAAGFGLCGLVLLVRTLPRVSTEGLFHVRGWEGGWGGRLGDVLLIVGGLVAWILVWNPVGFLLGATAYAGALMTRFRGRPVSSLALGLALALAIDWSFRRLLLVPLPLGPFTGIIW
jgi:putative tricarboxylic transport membrane protein